MTYHDIFTNTPVRLSEFCDELLNVRGDKNDLTDPSTNIGWDVQLCPTFNCSDEECADYKERTAGK